MGMTTGNQLGELLGKVGSPVGGLSSMFGSQFGGQPVTPSVSSMFANGPYGYGFQPTQSAVSAAAQPQPQPQQQSYQSPPWSTPGSSGMTPNYLDLNATPNSTWSMQQVQDYNARMGRGEGVDYYHLPTPEELRALHNQFGSNTQFSQPQPQQSHPFTPSSQYVPPSQWAQPTGTTGQATPSAGGLASLGAPPPVVQQGANPIAQRDAAYRVALGWT